MNQPLAGSVWIQLPVTERIEGLGRMDVLDKNGDAADVCADIIAELRLVEVVTHRRGRSARSQFGHVGFSYGDGYVRMRWPVTTRAGED